ncbi:hypothetical protein KS4_25900 [Poriferisphaera corsica]|uniref:Uncharacterized protein n=1 Tax=Poriferisphaera corsica TaxID=2528020 RepID=A0A517YWB4_9BACT|nr:hypothetical protein [Poriferisphaera corsica]QDU34520.1 hypothetical protein KS4_25900 [Poriferisphaera corsica]
MNNKTIIRAAYPLFLLILSCAYTLTLSAQQSIFDNPKNTPSTFHGINAGAPIWNGETKLTKYRIYQIASTGTRAIRINFRLDGNKEWTPELLKKYDIIIRHAHNARFKILGLLCNESTPGGQRLWNTTSPSPNNQYVKDFSQNAALLVDRYKRYIKTWEIWNEPDAWTNINYRSNPRQAGGTYILPEVFAHMLVQTNLALRNNKRGNLINDYNIKLVTGGLFAHDINNTQNTAAPYLQSLYNQTTTFNQFKEKKQTPYPWHILGYHFYIDQGKKLNPKKLTSYLDAITKTARENHDSSLLLITEFGWPTNPPSEQIQAENLAATYDIFQQRNDILGSYWYQWTDEPTQARGLIKKNSIQYSKRALDIFRKYCKTKPSNEY